jgi:molybdopterin converting factor subunit 1
MEVEVRLYAMLREHAGTDRVTLELAEGATVREALVAVGGRHGLRALIAEMPVVMAVNREYAGEDRELSEGDELALIPPVSGGAAEAGTAGLHVRITDEPLSVDSLARLVTRPAAGAVVTFQGTTRDVDELSYEAYREMAEERIAAIVSDAIARHGLEAAAAEHRIGRVPLSEASVAVAVSAAHRGEAFAGAREIIDRIKEEAPIWKKEIEAGRERWVEGTRAGGDDGRA